MRGVAQRVLDPEDYETMLQPIKVSRDKFAGLAIKGHHAAPSFNIQIGDEERRLINNKLMILGHNISKKKVEQYTNNEIKLEPQMLKL